MKVYNCINEVQKALCKVGISKDEKNVAQGFKFRGIDAIYNALSPLLGGVGLCILPRVLSREVTEKTTARGGTLNYVAVEVEFDFVCAEDGSKHTVKTYGEAMDSGDKATNKAMSAAYKYACLQAFCIPTEGDNDADATTHEVVAKPAVVNDARHLKVDPKLINEFKADLMNSIRKISREKNHVSEVRQWLKDVAVSSLEELTVAQCKSFLTKLGG